MKCFNCVWVWFELLRLLPDFFVAKAESDPWSPHVLRLTVAHALSLSHTHAFAHELTKQLCGWALSLAVPVLSFDCGNLHCGAILNACSRAIVRAMWISSQCPLGAGTNLHSFVRE